MQTPVTEPAQFLGAMHDGVNIVIALISLFVLALLVIGLIVFLGSTAAAPFIYQLF